MISTRPNDIFRAWVGSSVPSVLMVTLSGILSMAGCATPDSAYTYETLPQPKSRDSIAAQRHNSEGLQRIEAGEPETAQEAFRRALEADLWYAPAHNNLGLVLLEQGKAYEACWEFTYAAKLMPTSPCPANNLGLVMERVGRLDEAIEYYGQSLKIDPANIEVMGHLARAYVKIGHKDPPLQDLLKDLALKGGEGWDVWARQRLMQLGR